MKVSIVSAIVLTAASRILPSAAQTCAEAQAFASVFLKQQVEGCADDLSSCYTGMVCPSDFCVDGGDSVVQTCSDACTYSFQDWTVDRSVSGSKAVSNLDIGTFYIYAVTVASSFVAGGEGIYTFTREVVPKSDGTLETAPLQGFCSMTFNSQDCLCEQRFCDDSQTTYGYYLDCSAFQGGAIMNTC